MKRRGKRIVSKLANEVKEKQALLDFLDPCDASAKGKPATACLGVAGPGAGKSVCGTRKPRGGISAARSRS
jgi:hypothetical protein